MFAQHFGSLLFRCARRKHSVTPVLWTSTLTPPVLMCTFNDSKGDPVFVHFLAHARQAFKNCSVYTSALEDQGLDRRKAALV